MVYPVARRTLLCACLATFAIGPAADARVARSSQVATLPIVSSLEPIPDPRGAVAVSDSSPSTGPVGQPYYLRTVGPGIARDSSLLALGYGSQPLEASFDRVAGGKKRVVYSRCRAGSERGTPLCSLFAAQLVEPAGAPPQAGREIQITNGPAEAVDTHPSYDRGGVAFARLLVGRDTAELRYKPSLTAPAVRLPTGPRGVDVSELVDVALRGRRVAYVWRWFAHEGKSRYTVKVRRLTGGPPRTLLSVAGDRAAVTGLQWVYGRLIVGVREGNRSRLIRFDPRTGHSSTALLSRAGVSFALTRHALYVQTASIAPQHITCPCPVRAEPLPKFPRH
jgi:hypothetical protein